MTDKNPVGKPPIHGEAKSKNITLRLTPLAYEWLKAQQPSASEWIEQQARK